MDELIKKAIDALQGSCCNEIELTDGNLKVRVVKYTPIPMINNYPWQYQVPAQPY